MATTSKNTPASPTAKIPTAKKTAAETPAAKKPVAKVTAAAKKTAAPAAKKTAATPAKKTSTTKAVKPPAAENKPAKKASTPRKSTGKKQASPEQRYHMIATAAYYLAERRGFCSGYEMQDWISAEADIDAMLNG